MMPATATISSTEVASAPFSMKHRRAAVQILCRV